MKRRLSTPTIALIVVFAFLLVFQINLFKFSRLTRTNPKTTSPVKMAKDLYTRSSWDPVPPPRMHSIIAPIRCDRSHNNYDICSIHSPTVLDPSTSTFFEMGPSSSTRPHLVEKVRPYPRKAESFTMSRIKEVTLTSGPPGPSCQVQHNVPALVFSAGGYTGNVFHDFNDGFIPLFITVNSIFPNRDFVLVVSKSRDWWVSKYAELLHAFSKHPIVNFDNDTATHCFPSATVGLISHGFMTIDPKLIPNGSTSFKHFQSLLEKAYGQKTISHHHALFMTWPTRHRPRLILASRSGDTGRVLLNQAELKIIAEEEGFEVIIFEPKPTTPLLEAYALMNSSHAMIGVHGAALTHLLFLRPRSVFVQVVPIGTEWVSEACYGKPAKDLGLEYMEYAIGVGESSLVDKYGRDDMLLKDPKALQKNGWPHEIMTKYLKEQNVKLDLDRFRSYLKMAYGKAKEFMDTEVMNQGEPSRPRELTVSDRKRRAREDALLRSRIEEQVEEETEDMDAEVELY